MENLVDLIGKQKRKEKLINGILIFFIVILSVVFIGLFAIDPWDIAHNKENDKLKLRKEEFNRVYENYLENQEFDEAFVINYNLEIDDSNLDLYSILSDADRIKTNVRNSFEGNGEKNYSSLEYLVDTFYSEYYYSKKYRGPSDIYDQIKNEVEDYLIAFNAMDQEKIESIKKGNAYE